MNDSEEKRVKYGVGRRFLILTAGMIWLIAGVNILRIGVATWLVASTHWLLKGAAAAVVFLLFALIIFRKLYHKYTRRIEQKPPAGNNPFDFFDLKGWLTMILMITMGGTIRHFRLLPDTFIAFFYTGLSTALLLTGFLFIRYGWRMRTARL